MYMRVSIEIWSGLEKTIWFSPWLDAKIIHKDDNKF